MKSLAEYIMEKQGIFNGCEDIANEMTLQFVQTIKNTKSNYRCKFIFDASKYNPIFRDDIVVNIEFEKPKNDKYKILSNTSIDIDKINNYIMTGTLWLSVEEIENIKRKPYSINLSVSPETIDLYDVKAILMHELTHFYTAIIFYDKGKNYFNRPYYSPDDWDNKSEHLLYFIQQDEVNSWVVELKSELDKIKKTGFDSILNKLKDNDKFKQIIEYKDDFNIEWSDFDFNKLKLDKYVELYREHIKNISKYEIYNITKKKINNAYNQLYRTVIKMCNEYKGQPDFIENNFGYQYFDVHHYLPMFKQYRRTSVK